MARLDPHSYADLSQARVARLSWRARVDFASRTLEGTATLHLEGARPGPLDLDTRELTVLAVRDGEGRPLPFSLAEPEPVLGARLRVELPAGVREVAVDYRTAPTASALQWLAPGQTEGGRHPFLFSQCQAVHARSVVPLQDTPRARLTYTAELRVPRALRAVMGARHEGREEAGEEARERFAMPQPIPPYLLALAVGELASVDLSPRARVWAEPERVEAAAHEFAHVERMLAAAEALFGPYDWERFDLLTMPPSFPYGGMENPRLSFLTPTLLAGDRSLVNVVVHELAHSWTGNLVTNADAEHFWLNEGFTVWAERRILEALEGREVAELHAALGRRALEAALRSFADRPELTRLRTHLVGVDPDEAFSSVPYEKGYLLLRALEEQVGRARWDAFVGAYLRRFRFGALTTEDFERACEEELPGALAAVDAAAYLHAPGVPPSAPSPRSARLERVQALAGRLAEVAEVEGWTPAEWQLYLELFGDDTPLATVEALEARFALTAHPNMEVLASWLVLAVRTGHALAVERAEEVLGEVGRMKYLKPLYAALAVRPATRTRARALFARVGARYHPIAREGVERILTRAGA
jgi:aminopeptidase N